MVITTMNSDFRAYQNLGMNRNISEFLPLNGEWRKILNAEMNKLGILVKRDGYTKKLNNPDTDKEVLSLIPFELGSVRKLIMINKAGKLYAKDPIVDADWGTAILSGLDTSARWTATVMSDSSGNKYMVLGNGVNVKKTADAAAFSDITNVPLGKYWAQLFQRGFTAGVPADSDVLHASSIADITDWSAVSPSDSYSQNIDRFSGGTIQGIKESNDRIIIYKKRRIKKWDGEYLKTVMASAGLDAPYSLADIEGMIFSLDREAIRLFDGEAPSPISERIQDLIDGISFASANIERICATVYKKRYHLSLGTITDEDGNSIPNCWIVFDFIRNLFWIHSLGHQATAMCKLECSDGVERLYFGDVTGNLYHMFSGSLLDDTLPIQMLLESHDIYPAGPEVTIQPKVLTLVTKFADECKVQISADGGSPENIGELENNVSQHFLSEAFGNDVRSIKLTIAHADEGRPQFKGWGLNFDIISNNRINS